jgi:LysR family transcriptional regulator, glycine cleavage system transcriptional activator
MLMAHERRSCVLGQNGSMRSLPPFAELVAFEAVARHLSFTRASEELCITQSAVSHRIRRLEAHFGASLIERAGAGGLALTDTGQAMLPELVAALDHLSRLGRHGGRQLRVAAGSALCTWWLAGRLPAFMAQHEGVSVELVPVGSPDSPIPQADVRILWVPADEAHAHPHQAPLFQELVFPVCSPRLLEGGRPLRDARRLAEMTLLHKTSSAAGEWSWPVWLERLGVDRGTQRAELSFTEMSLVMSAALDGAGVALTRSLLAHDAMVAGRLVPAVAGLAPMTSSKHHVARWPSSKNSDAVVAAFVDWMVTEARGTLASTAAMLDALT